MNPSDDHHEDEQPPEVAPPARRRRVDVSAGATLVLGLPWFLASVVAIGAIASRLGQPGATVLVLGWIASGLLVFYPPMGYVLASTLFRLRRPTPPEHEYLESVWGPVTAAAGVDANQYSLWIEDSQHVNAFAAGGNIVAVTTWAIQMLRPAHLAAVLAHELGHHLGGHSWTRLLSFWYSLPARLVIASVRIVTTWVLWILAYMSCLGFLVAALLLALAAFTLFQTYAPILLVFAIPPLLAFFGRQAELRADRLAAELGFGRALIEVFQRWIEEGYDERRTQVLLATHPTCADRIRALESFLAIQPGNDGGPARDR